LVIAQNKKKQDGYIRKNSYLVDARLYVHKERQGEREREREREREIDRERETERARERKTDTKC
jgi:hypothetical protein